MSLRELQDWYKKNEKKVIESYLELLSIPSISTELRHKKDLLACAKWVGDYLRNSDFEVEEIKTEGYPLVLGQKIKDPQAKTLLLYGHYDVQPVDPIDEWDSDPFQPKVDGIKVVARGAQDNKGQLMYMLAALRAVKDFSLNVKIIVEGEEEKGSYGLESKLPEIKDKLKADYLLVVDMEIPERNTPAVTLGARGMYALTIQLTGSSTDLHSGQFGGIAYNPLKALTKMLSACTDEQGKVLIPGFYDDVQELTEEEKKEIDFSLVESSNEVYSFWKEEGYSLAESNWTRPTFEINGIFGGYAGEGFKTVIPKKAVAKISCRLVSNQDPKKIGKNLKEYLQKLAPDGMKIKMIDEGMGDAARGSVKGEFVQAVQNAYEEVFQTPCKKMMAGGSVPITARLKLALKSELLLMGMGLSSDNIHAPNENFDKERLEKGFLVIGRLLETLR